MGKENKLLLFLLVAVLACSSLLMVQPVNAQTITKPAIPEFTVKVTEHSIDVPVSFSTDPYTGKNITHLAEHYEWITIDISIKKQSHSYDLYFSVEMRGHFSQNWLPLAYVKQYDDNIATELSFVPQNQTYPPTSSGILDVPLGSQLDFRVKAWTGYEARGGPPFYSWTKFGAESDYSNIHTITIPETSPSSSNSPNPTPTPSVPELSWLALIPLIISIFLVAVLLTIKRKRHT